MQFPVLAELSNILRLKKIQAVHLSYAPVIQVEQKTWHLSHLLDALLVK